MQCLVQVFPIALLSNERLRCLFFFVEVTVESGSKIVVSSKEVYLFTLRMSVENEMAVRSSVKTKTARMLRINYRDVTGAFERKRKLKLVAVDSMFNCPISTCRHFGFRSKRGLRKHLETCHPWYFFFDVEPDIRNEIKAARNKTKDKNFSRQIPSFSLESGIGKSFLDWLGDDCGGGKKIKDATQSCRRAMKFLLHASGTSDASDVDLTANFVDLCLGSSLIITNFLKTLQLEWEVGYAGSYNYLCSIEELMDFRKSQSVSNEVLRNFTVTEVYLRRGKRNLKGKIKADWVRNFDLENLISKNSWASLEEMERVIPFHLPRFKKVIEACQSKTVLPSDLTFSTRFITTLLFLRVKCSRPMTFQFLTVPMINKAKKEGGFIDNHQFKTAKHFMFDSILIDDNVFKVLDLYINHCRPLLNPKSDYLLITSSGTMLQNLCYGMTIITYEAIQKYINPTRYRQIVETASSDLLTPEEQDIISRDQKHNSNVARVYYRKKESREIAEKGQSCVAKMAGESRINTNVAIESLLSDINASQNSFDLGFVQNSVSALSDVEMVDVDDNVEPSPSVINIDDENDQQLQSKVSDILTPPITIDDRDIKVEEMKNQSRTQIRFTSEEDGFLSDGIRKYGCHDWASILSDKNYIFNKCRSRDSLRVRANSVVFKRKYNL